MKTAWCADFSIAKINHYSIHVPTGYVLRDVTPQMADFDLFEITNQEDHSDKLSIYFGNHPHFPVYDWKDPPSESTDAAVRKTVYNYRASDGSLEGMLVFSGLSYRHSAQSPYSRIHYFAKATNSEASERFLKIIASIEVANPNL
jgi:hypothetical protein